MTLLAEQTTSLAVTRRPAHTVEAWSARSAVVRQGPVGAAAVAKRGLDVVGSLVGLFLLAPLMLAVALLVKVTDPAGPVLYRQQRVGRGGRPVGVLKFRSIRLGRLLRVTSLDELPQLVNALLGHLSLVGPRPIVIAELERYGADAASYLAVRPGVTGLWQVSGRSDTSYDTRVGLDRRSVQQWRLTMDLSILVRTVSTVLNRDGAR